MLRRSRSPHREGAQRARLQGNDTGAAAVEFLLMGLVLLVPLTYLIVALAQIQNGALAAEAAARQLSRALAVSSSSDSAAARADTVLHSIVEQFGIRGEDVEVVVRCEPATMPCPAAGATLHVEVMVEVALPLVPDVFDLPDQASVEVTADGVQKVSRLWAGP